MDFVPLRDGHLYYVANMAVTYAASASAVNSKVELSMMLNRCPLPNFRIDLLVAEENSQVFLD